MLTTDLDAGGFVLLLYVHLQQVWMLQGLCCYCTSTYNLSWCCRLSVIIACALTIGCMLQALCYCCVFTFTYNRLHVAGFVLLLCVYFHLQ